MSTNLNSFMNTTRFSAGVAEGFRERRRAHKKEITVRNKTKQNKTK